MYLRGALIISLMLLLGFLYGVVFRVPTQTFLRENTFYPGEEYPLYDPETAPQEIREQVIKGFKIVRETKRYLPDYAGDRISCTNCHFSGGNSFGGRGNGFSLVGVDHKYPKILESGKEYTLTERINSCFMRSLNGKPLPLDGPDMQSIVTYLKWISRGVPKLTNYPWMGINEIRSKHVPDVKNGAQVYEVHCALCHGKNGAGQERPFDLSYPPLWGESSFNDGAGMNALHTFAYFVYENMPYSEPKLTLEEALDVSAFVLSQKRPKFTPPEE